MRLIGVCVRQVWFERVMLLVSSVQRTIAACLPFTKAKFERCMADS